MIKYDSVAIVFVDNKNPDRKRVLNEIKTNFKKIVHKKLYPKYDLTAYVLKEDFITYVSN